MSETNDTTSPKTSTTPPNNTATAGAGFKVLMGCDTFAPDVNGAARFAERLAAGLVARGLDVQIVAPAPNKKDYGTRLEVVEGQSLTVHRLASHKLWLHEWLRFTMPWVAGHWARRLIAQQKPDAVHVQSHILIGRALSKVAAKKGIPLVATNHVMPENILDLKNMPQFVRQPLLNIAWADAGRVLNRASRVTTPTKKAAEFLEKNTNRTGVLPVSCGINAADYTPDLGLKTKNRIVFVGRLNHEKQVNVVIEALAKCDPALEVQFDVIGGGDQLEFLKQRASELGVSERIDWHGKASDEQLRRLLSEAKIFVMASIAELQSIATLEAMASGLPVLVANAMALPHLVDDGKNGYLFEPGDSTELAAKMQHILRLPHEQYVQMQEASLEMVEGHDIDRTLDAFEGLYRGR